MELRVENGRPSVTEGRSPREMRVYDFLDSLEVAYRRVDHPAVATMEDCVAPKAALGAPLCKNLVLCNRQETAFYLLLMPGEKPFRTKDLSAQIGSARLSFASPERMEELLGVTPGCASVMGLLHDTVGKVQLLIDRDLLEEATFGCHPCVTTASIAFPTDVLLRTVLPALKRNPRLVTL
ncbi:MAG: prolyl-tRNA synthetase associated domain-containing protein [Ruminococcaceae bacterium]|nr:prolyl-tRNA synthetase associated domain-containing protein [Oscillospiraceae bacterium]